MVGVRGVYGHSMRVAAALRRRVIEARKIRPLFSSISRDARILEIGGGYNPKFMKRIYRNAYHLDHCTTEELKAKYQKDPSVARLVGRIQEVDFVANQVPIESVIPAHLKFEVIYSSHALEHQVDLIAHLRSIETLIAPGGRFIAVVPDYRSCFDVLRFPTVTGDVIAVHLAGHRLHRSKQIFDNFSRTVNVNPGRRIGLGDTNGMQFQYTLEYAWRATLNCEAADATYLDAHAWIFSPLSFELLLIELYLLNLTRLVPKFISPSYGHQFCVVLRSGTPLDEITTEARAALESRRLALCKRLRR